MDIKSLGSKLFTVTAAALLLAACATKPEPTPAPADTPDTGYTPAVETTPVDTTPLTPLDQLKEYAGSDMVLFSYDSADLTSDARETLRAQADWLNQNGSYRAIVEGHCDERGTREYNLALGERRAVAVKNYLVALGVNASRLQSISYGKERPLDPRSTDMAWSKNRRGTLVLN